MADEFGRKSLYIKRPVLNGSDIAGWARDSGLPCLDPKDMHVTVAHSRKPVSWRSILRDERKELVAEFPLFRRLNIFGKNDDCLVLEFICDELWHRWRQLLESGLSWDFEGYRPHITLSYDFNAAMPQAPAFQEQIVLGSEIWEEAKED